ncbi:MAG: HAD hydrolase-like protein, partial [Pseudomonas sp.]
RVFPAVTGKPLRQLAEVTGRTELIIMHDTLQFHDVDPSEQMMRRLTAALIQGHEDARTELATTGRVLPGAQQTLAALAADSRVHQAVLSGNLRDVSRIKLEVFGLDTYLDLASSAYGDDHTERSTLVTIAQQRATERMAARFDNQHTVLIGDTPKDVEAALTAGVQVIAVASGKSNENDLTQAGASATVSDLTHTATIVQLVTEGLQTSADHA